MGRWMNTFIYNIYNLMSVFFCFFKSVTLAKKQQMIIKEEGRSFA